MEKSHSLTRNGFSRIKSVLRRAKLILFWERIWPALFSLLMIAMVYACASWFGVWSFMPVWLKVIALGLFAIAILLTLSRASRLTLPKVDETIARVEMVSGVSHRPLTASLDLPVGETADPSSPQSTLWRAHQQRIAEGLSKLKAGWPQPLTQRLDPFASRAVLILATFIGFNVAGPDRLQRLTDGFDFSIGKATVVARLDAWVTPPRYTGKPPIFLTKEDAEFEVGSVVVPAGSLLKIRSVNADATVVTFSGEAASGSVTGPIAIAAQKLNQAENPTSNSNQTDYEFKLDESGTITVGKAELSRSWAFDVLPDSPPIIAFIDDPEVQRSGALQILATMKDDYGITQADVVIEPIGAGVADTARPLYEAPQFPLSLRRDQAKDGTSKTVRSLTDHPWAGAEVAMTLRAVDAAGQEGLSEVLTLSLPSRRFFNPLSRALIEQRRSLAMDGNYANQLVDVIDVLTVRPEQFNDDYAALITLASIQRGLLDARNDDALRKVVDDLWDLAVGLEDGDLSDAERALREALEALREGIRDGASEEELARLLEDAREAMNEFMQALSEQAQRNSDTAQNQQPTDPSQTLDPQDLQEMLDRIQELAQTGSRDAAEQLLSELQQMMENLQAQNQQRQQGESQEQQALNELGEMIRRQQQLLDQTYREQQEGPGNQQGEQPGQSQQGQRGQQRGQQPGQQPGQQFGQDGRPSPGQGQQGQQSQNGQSLEQGQSALADQLQRFMDGLGPGPHDPSGQLGEAERSMRGAAGQLGEGDLGGAGEDQSQALNELRAGARALAEQMAGEGQGEGDQSIAGGNRGTDPLGRRDGRRSSDFGDDVEVPDEIDTQRAREILDAIRERLGETLRPQIELEYLERLLQSE
ncbi:MAG: TIGR02302 family protein [Hyphomicrobiales bacterium]